MEFRLLYRGPLPAEKGGSVALKRDIRRQFHEQIAELWKQRPALRSRESLFFPNINGETPLNRKLAKFEIATKSNHIHHFLPLIGEDTGTSCSLDILFLRRESAGGLVTYGGDIDNRIKTLFDALQRPQHPNQLPDEPQPQEEDPMHCLLEDDKYIDQVSIVTDRLLIPLANDGGSHKIHDVELVIRVKTIVTNFKIADHALW
jgi:hypothetical protein